MGEAIDSRGIDAELGRRKEGGEAMEFAYVPVCEFGSDDVRMLGETDDVV